MWRTLALGLALLAAGPVCAAADGGPVRSFGHGGSISFAPQRFSSAAGVAVDAQGRILIGATLDDGSLLRTRAAVLRLLPDGSLDPAFGNGGVATIAPPAPYATSRAEAIALDAQGRTTVAGEVDDDVPAVARLLADGTLDPSFASGGLLIAKGAYGGLPGGWKSIALYGSDIVLAGAVDGAPPFGTNLGRIAVVARITDNGVPDASFAGGGFLALPIAGVTFASTHSVAIDRGGRIVLGIWRATTVAFPGDVAAAVVRISVTGTLDATFGSDGLTVLGPLQGRAPAPIITRRDNILALGGWTAPAGGIASAARLRADGRLDETFASAGELTAAEAPAAGAYDCEGHLLIAGAAGVSRRGSDGRLDRTFRGAGIPAVAVGATSAGAVYDSLAVAPDGSVVVSGTAADGPVSIGGATQSGATALAVARVKASCPLLDFLPPTVTLRCTAGCRRVAGMAIDDAVGRGIQRVLLGIERIAGTRCEAWNGRRFTSFPCDRAAQRLRAVPLVHGAFTTPPLGSGRFIVRAVALDPIGNRSRLAVRRVSR
ncbi:MAG TPA: hypothetical protein VFD90_07310 [Gaiellales bacterium]|jgi:uncharacterized delta-60 repeat protein|nr:hypothetical protein [Gaiellales bacterium]